MCHLFAGIPVHLYESETRSMRLSGHATSIRLEAVFWQILEDLAASQRLSLPKFLTTLHEEVLELHDEARNFTSLLRCACLTHLERANGDLSATAPSWPALDAAGPARQEVVSARRQIA
ncbi:ribbon-helix-helix domain-containing protein [Aurantimonas sp. VKM B-3413]|uniref:ribbon-helix-helix domain-containing protein n=1 Tax=Aurantimonas sp. VKM B-3413 TaxID=2779401 RepID=UPI001E444EBD|nr:ribbon-helix-helix domain-containing protein [Aurantimonas sp. VKM B-3413]MCB8837714.1 ribbon-helix-helix domain-containing protein [Aurantimonas sp. VKM B-3413]